MQLVTRFVVLLVAALVPTMAVSTVGTRSPTSSARRKHDKSGPTERESRSVVLERLSNERAVRTVTVPDGIVRLRYSARGRLVSVELEARQQRTERTSTEPDALNYLSIARAARFAGMNPTWLRRKAQSGELKALRLSREWFTTVTWLESFLANRRPRGRPAKQVE